MQAAFDNPDGEVPAVFSPDLNAADAPELEEDFPLLDEEEANALADQHRAAADEQVHADPKIVHFGGQAGAPLAQDGQDAAGTYVAYQGDLAAHDPANLWAPFRNKMEWEIARWAKMRGPTSTAFTELLQIAEVRERLDLSFKTTSDINKIVDTQLPPCAEFTCDEITVDGESYELYSRDIMQCIRELYGNPEFLSTMKFAPEEHYADDEHEVPIYSEMNTGRWWHSMQTRLEAHTPGATVVPIILSSDKTQVTDFRNKSAYPLYLTIGNISKDVRRQPSKRAQILIGYLPAARLSHIKEDDTRRRAIANLFHACVRKITSPTRPHALAGIPMASGDGVVRRCHPIFAVFIGDYPEQVLVACVKSGECPKCQVDAEDLGVHAQAPTRSIAAARAALGTLDDGVQAYVQACQHAGIKPVYHPFWEDLPHSNVFQAVTPDILHQLHQGIVKHLLSWLTNAFGAEEIDARCSRLPPNHSIRIFKNGLSILSRVSGQEHKDISRILLGLIVDLNPLAGVPAAHVVRAVRALLDFLYLAQYPSHSESTLKYLEKALKTFHANKFIFEELGIRQGFNIPKLHSLLHYVASIRAFGTTDNYNTEATERLHIDYAKDAYRSTNHKDVYPQMTRWLVRREQILRHTNFIRWRVQQAANAAAAPVVRPARPRFHVARIPSFKSVSFTQLATRYGAVDFREALAAYIIKEVHPQYSPAHVANLARDYDLTFRAVATYNSVKFSLGDPQDRDDAPAVRDAVHTRPSYRDTRGRAVPGRFDTALINQGDGGASTVSGYQVAQVRVIFSLPVKARAAAFPQGYQGPVHLAYVEWFTPFTPVAEPNHQMYRVARKFRAGLRRHASVVAVKDIHRSAHLIPRFGPQAPRHWTSANVLDKCRIFYVSSFVDRHTYITVY
ncbi:hypothetical protein FA95DRAFT_1502450 [Auriscalpium vulgare]|uniref:Uncharacterized protein n=2 Tax=Auriscalpium vulgare TaxID=40419 RepID=A0ACB8R4D0_9AGAM|nr:hypothetical protein FA95DRAFT_1504801 [Auriscalpium vulgare]KAI0040691.1 hypothetical protein FA95DRAFT_1502450 [Auriscalpium vulgare]